MNMEIKTKINLLRYLIKRVAELNINGGSPREIKSSILDILLDELQNIPTAEIIFDNGD